MSDQELIARLRRMSPRLDMLDCEDVLTAADRIEALTAKLATCEKYRDAYAECDRIGTQAVRDLEAKLAQAVEALEFLEIAATGSGVPHPKERELLHDCIRKARTTLAEIKGESHD